MACSQFPDFVVAHHLDIVGTMHAAVTGHPTPHVPASTRRGWRVRLARNQRILASACAATAVALGGDITELDYQAALAAFWATLQRRGEHTPPVWRS